MKLAILMEKSGLDRARAQALLDQCQGRLAPAIQQAKEARG